MQVTGSDIVLVADLCDSIQTIAFVKLHCLKVYSIDTEPLRNVSYL